MYYNVGLQVTLPIQDSLGGLMTYTLAMRVGD
jgi:hypothetical protein